jgi:hypothetical protein
MAQNIDDFFKQKIENIQDTLPENSAFDETLLWENIQQDLRKPKRFAWYWISAAACLVALVSWWISINDSRGVSHTPVAIVHEKPIITPTLIENEIKNTNSKKHLKVFISKKNKIIAPQILDFQVESIASKNIDFSNKNIKILPDSLNFQSNIAFEKKPKMNFKTVHINEISKHDDAPFKQPRFKVQFAGTLFEKAESNNNEIIKTPSIRTQ